MNGNDSSKYKFLFHSMISSEQGKRALRGSKRKSDCKPIDNCFNQQFFNQLGFDFPPLVKNQVIRTKQINCFQIMNFEFKTKKNEGVLQTMRLASSHQMKKVYPVKIPMQSIKEVGDNAFDLSQAQVERQNILTDVKLIEGLESPIRDNFGNLFEQRYINEYFGL